MARIHIREIRVGAVSKKHRRDVLLPRLGKAAEHRPLFALCPIDTHVHPIVDGDGLTRCREIAGIGYGVTRGIRQGIEVHYFQGNRIHHRLRDAIVREWSADKPCSVGVRNRRERIVDGGERSVGVPGSGKIANALLSCGDVRDVGSRTALAESFIGAEEE